MKRLLFFTAIIVCSMQIACRKSSLSCPITNSLNGKWRMVLVKDNASGLTTNKPSSIQNDVDITFTPTNATTGTFNGNTPTNEISQNDYSLGANQTISMLSLSMTKVAETSWGSLFVDNINASQNYTFENGGMLDITTIKKTLVFRKL